MRALFALIGVAALLLVGAMSLGIVRVHQTRDAVMPDVALEGGQTPKFQADVANVSLGTEEKTVTVPTIAMKETKVALPALKVEKPVPADNTTAPATAN